MSTTRFVLLMIPMLLSLVFLIKSFYHIFREEGYLAGKNFLTGGALFVYAGYLNRHLHEI